MDIEVEDRFFTTLNAVISARLGAEHPCAIAAAKAAREPSTPIVRAAHKELNDLDPGVRGEIISELQSWMRPDA